MGCDIHAHLEILWQEDGQESCWLYYTPLSINRDYRLFARMANVRNYRGEVTPIAAPRDLPTNISQMTRIRASLWGDDGHSHSWLSLEELCQIINEQSDKRIMPKAWLGLGWEGHPWMDEFPGVYLFGGSICGFLKYSGDGYPRKLRDVRIVFWFDN
jgi:hypothetical protein